MRCVCLCSSLSSCWRRQAARRTSPSSSSWLGAHPSPCVWSVSPAPPHHSQPQPSPPPPPPATSSCSPSSRATRCDWLGNKRRDRWVVAAVKGGGVCPRYSFMFPCVLVGVCSLLTQCYVERPPVQAPDIIIFCSLNCWTSP